MFSLTSRHNLVAKCLEFDCILCIQIVRIVLHFHHSYSAWGIFLCRIPMDVWLQVGSRLELQSELPNYIDGLSLPIKHTTV